MVVKKNVIRNFVIYFVLIVVVCVSLGMSSTASVFFGKSTRKVPVYSVATASEEKLIALTFDAAWGADKTSSILEIMNEHDALGTFFLVGFWIDKFPEEVKRIADMKFEIGNHSKNHLNMSRLDVGVINKEIEYVNTKIKEITGVTPVYFRPPFGDYNNKLLDALEAMKMVTVQWSIDSLDWKGLSASEIANRVVPKAKSGDIVLFHNNSDNIVEALPLILVGLKTRGFKFCTLSDLVATSNYTIDSNGVQHKI